MSAFDDYDAQEQCEESYSEADCPASEYDWDDEPQEWADLPYGYDDEPEYYEPDEMNDG